MTTTGSNATRPGRAWLCLPPTLACGADVLMTLLGQRREYWGGDYQAVVEFNPAARLLLQVHPLAFGLAAAVSCALVALIVMRVNAGLAVFFSIVVTFCHAVAAASWLARLGVAGIGAAALLLLGVERATSLAIRRVR